MVRYNAIEDPLCYAGTNVLKNIPDIQDQDQLDQYEQLMFQTRAEELLPVGEFDLKHYQALHHHFFQDVYDWAGKLRVIRTAKGANSFCYPEFIEKEMHRIFKELAIEKYLQEINDKVHFSERAAYYLSEINAVHPFREGNGRIQLTFLTLLALNTGFELNEDQIEEAPFLGAMIKSFDGVLEPLSIQIERML
jgi:cell filamentation protein